MYDYESDDSDSFDYSDIEYNSVEPIHDSYVNFHFYLTKLLLKISSLKRILKKLLKINY